MIRGNNVRQAYPIPYYGSGVARASASKGVPLEDAYVCMDCRDRMHKVPRWPISSCGPTRLLPMHGRYYHRELSGLTRCRLQKPFLRLMRHWVDIVRWWHIALMHHRGGLCPPCSSSTIAFHHASSYSRIYSRIHVCVWGG